MPKEREREGEKEMIYWEHACALHQNHITYCNQFGSINDIS